MVISVELYEILKYINRIGASKNIDQEKYNYYN